MTLEMTVQISFADPAIIREGETPGSIVQLDQNRRTQVRVKDDGIWAVYE